MQKAYYHFSQIFTHSYLILVAKSSIKLFIKFNCYIILFYFNFSKKMKNTKNVIYTFIIIDNALLENVSGQFDIELLGRIDKSNIKEVKINSLNEEKDLESILEDVYLNQGDKIKIVLFKFTPYQAGIMNYIKFFIKNHIKESN